MAFHTFLVPHFPPLQFGAAFSSPAYSTPAIWCRIFQSCIFHPCNLVPYFPVLHIPVPHFQRPLRSPAKRPVNVDNMTMRIQVRLAGEGGLCQVRVAGQYVTRLVRSSRSEIRCYKRIAEFSRITRSPIDSNGSLQVFPLPFHPLPHPHLFSASVSCIV